MLTVLPNHLTINKSVKSQALFNIHQQQGMHNVLELRWEKRYHLPSCCAMSVPPALSRYRTLDHKHGDCCCNDPWPNLRASHCSAWLGRDRWSHKHTKFILKALSRSGIHVVNRNMLLSSLTTYKWFCKAERWWHSRGGWQAERMDHFYWKVIESEVKYCIDPGSFLMS